MHGYGGVCGMDCRMDRGMDCGIACGVDCGVLVFSPTKDAVAIIIISGLRVTLRFQVVILVSPINQN